VGLSFVSCEGADCENEGVVGLSFVGCEGVDCENEGVVGRSLLFCFKFEKGKGGSLKISGKLSQRTSMISDLLTACFFSVKELIKVLVNLIGNKLGESIRERFWLSILSSGTNEIR